MVFRFALKQTGFTLIETIIGIVLLSLTLAMIVPVLIPTEEQSVDQIQQIRAAELGQSLLNEILAKSFDEQSDRAGGIERCDETSTACSNSLGNEESNNRVLFDDVDDYITNGFTANLKGANGQALGDEYNGFLVDVQVSYDGNTLALSNNRLAKRIQVTVRTPSGADIIFAAYKVNF